MAPKPKFAQSQARGSTKEERTQKDWRSNSERVGIDSDSARERGSLRKREREYLRSKSAIARVRSESNSEFDCPEERERENVRDERKERFSMIKFSGGGKEKLYAAASRCGWSGPLFVT